MRRFMKFAFEVHPAFVGFASAGVAVVLEKFNNIVGILVGLITIVYLAVRVILELRK